MYIFSIFKNTKVLILLDLNDVSSQVTTLSIGGYQVVTGKKRWVNGEQKGEQKGEHLNP